MGVGCLGWPVADQLENWLRTEPVTPHRKMLAQIGQLAV